MALQLDFNFTKLNPLPDHIDMIEAMLDGLYERAKVVCDKYWSDRMFKESDNTVTKSIVGSRIRRSESGGVSCDWYYNDFKRSTDNNARKFFSKPIPLKRDDSSEINMRELKSKTKQWEFPMVVYTESEYVQIRKLSKQLVDLKRKTRHVSESYEKFLHKI
jgi:hypothetical protein